jgi:hypothetical protein
MECNRNREKKKQETNVHEKMRTSLFKSGGRPALNSLLGLCGWIGHPTASASRVRINLQYQIIATGTWYSCP